MIPSLTPEPPSTEKEMIHNIFKPIEQSITPIKPIEKLEMQEKKSSESPISQKQKSSGRSKSIEPGRMSVPHPMLLPNFDLSMVTHLTPEKEKIFGQQEEEVKIEENEYHDNQMEILSEDSEELRKIDEELRLHAETHIAPQPPFLP